MAYSKHDILEQKMCKELATLEEKLANGADMSMADLDKIDKLYHALKSKATYDAMKESEEYGEGGMSGYRGRAANGRYVSRDMSFEDGYSRGYSEAMDQMGNSGYHPMMPRRY